MKYNNKFLKSGIAYTIGNFALKGINIVTIPIFTTMLTTEEFGRMTYFNSWLAIFTIIIGLNLYSSIRNAYIEYKDSVDEFLSSISILALGFFTVLLLVSNTIFILFKVKVAFAIVANLMLFQSFGAFMINVINNKFTFEFQYKKFLMLAFSTTLTGVFLSIIFIKFVFLTDAFYGKIFGAAIPVIIAGAWIIITIIKSAKIKYNKEIWRFALLICIPLIPHVLSNFILSQSDRIMINHFLGDKYTGIYGFIYNISMILTIFWTSLDAVWVPWYTKNMGEGKYKEIKEVSKKYIVLFTIITLCLLFVSPEVSKILTRNKELWLGIEIVPPILISGYFMFLYSLPVNVEYFYKKTGLISIGTFIAAIINIGLNLIFLPRYGYEVAAYTTLISYIFLFVFHWINMKKICKEDLFSINYILTSILVIIIGATVFSLLRDFMIIRWIITATIGITVLVVLYKNKDTILSMKKC